MLLYIHTYGTVNAWAVQLEAFPEHPNYDFVIYVADQETINLGAYMYYLNNHSFSPIDNIIVDAMVKDIAFGDGLVYVAKVTDGVDVYQTEGTYTFTMNDYNYTFDCFLHSPCYIDNYNTSVLANRLSVFDNKLAVSDWDDVEILEWNTFFSIGRNVSKDTGEASEILHYLFTCYS